MEIYLLSEIRLSNGYEMTIIFDSKEKVLSFPVLDANLRFANRKSLKNVGRNIHITN